MYQTHDTEEQVAEHLSKKLLKAYIPKQTDQQEKTYPLIHLLLLIVLHSATFLPLTVYSRARYSSKDILLAWG